jgi:2-polyprenyl-6-methoxyphenol hydroxylase-like FAD-dependent oxidoreductase
MSASGGRAIVIGGSLAGLFAGLLLRRHFDVDIYERADTELAGRGAGIVTHELLSEALDAVGVPWRTGFGVEVETRRLFERDGRLSFEFPYRQIVTAWDRLYNMLRDEFPAAHYHCGKELVAVEERPTSVLAWFADGSTAEGALLVGADGLRSRVRTRFLPEANPIYAGYAAWRALVPETAVAADLHEQVFGHMAFCLPMGEHMLGYPVAGPDNDLRHGHRRYNLVWYRPADRAALDRLLTDDDGVHHPFGIPPPLISRAVVAEMREAADTVLAPQFRDLIRLVRQPMLQAVYDVESPRMAFGRVALIGDAAFVARPHVGAGVAKAAQDALALVRALDAAPDVMTALKRMETTQQPFGRRVIARARELGACLQQHHATAAERENAARFRVPQAAIRETATLEFLGDRRCSSA